MNKVIGILTAILVTAAFPYPADAVTANGEWSNAFGYVPPHVRRAAGYTVTLNVNVGNVVPCNVTAVFYIQYPSTDNSPDMLIWQYPVQGTISYPSNSIQFSKTIIPGQWPIALFSGMKVRSYWVIMNTGVIPQQSLQETINTSSAFTTIID